MIGLEWPRPGIVVFQSTFFPDSPFHSMGGDPAAIPPASGPRNWGQLESAAKARRESRSVTAIMILVYALDWDRFSEVHCRVRMWGGPPGPEPTPLVGFGL